METWAICNHIFMDLEPYQIAKMIFDAKRQGAKELLMELGLLKPMISRAEANRIYGKTIIDRWVKEGLIEPIKDGNRTAGVRLSRVRLDELEYTSNRGTYLTVAELK